MDIRRVGHDMIQPTDASHNAASVEIERRRQEERQREKRRQQHPADAEADGDAGENIGNATVYNSEGHVQEVDAPGEAPPHSIDFRA